MNEPAELLQLKARFDQIVSEHDEGMVSYDDAAAAIAAMTVVDGAGATWSFSPSGELLRAEAGGAALPASVDLFVPLSGTSAGWGSPVAPSGADWGAPPVVPGVMAGPADWSTEESSLPSQPVQKKRRVLPVLTGRTRTLVLVAGISVAVVVLLLLVRSLQDPAGTAGVEPSSSSSSETVLTPGLEGSAEVGDSGEEDARGAVESADQGGGSARADDISAALTSGDVTTLDSVIKDLGSDEAAAVRAQAFSAFAPGNTMTLRVTLQGKKAAVEYRRDDQVVATVTVKIVGKGKKAQLASWPSFP